MKKWLAILVVFASFYAHAVPVAPIVQPHVTFVDGAGLPCAGCKLYTYHAGTTTPLATYLDSTGTGTNQNPVILDAAGGAQIWLGSNSYRFDLKNALGTLIWTVDNVNAGNLFPCGPAHTIQASNSAVNGLECDSQITINTTNHTISVGTLPANHVTIGALGTPTSWNFDTTSPDTARASINAGQVGAGTINQIAIYPATGSAVGGSSSIPAGVTAITQAPSDNSTNPATTAYVASPGAIGPTSIALAAGTAMTANQGTGASVQHSTGATTTDDCAKYDATGNTVDSGAPCSIGVTGQLVIGSPFTVVSNGCTPFSTTLTGSVPTGHVLVIGLSPESTVTGINQEPFISSISGTSVTVDFCNAWAGTVTISASTWNLGVI